MKTAINNFHKALKKYNSLSKESGKLFEQWLKLLDVHNLDINKDADQIEALMIDGKSDFYFHELKIEANDTEKDLVYESLKVLSLNVMKYAGKEAYNNMQHIVSKPSLFVNFVLKSVKELGNKTLA
jgi:hypothetical protein